MAIRVMESWYMRNEDHPYPNNQTVEVLSSAGQIAPGQVRKWFANRRLRSKNTKPQSVIAQHKKEAERKGIEVDLVNGAQDKQELGQTPIEVELLNMEDLESLKDFLVAMKKTETVEKP